MPDVGCRVLALVAVAIACSPAAAEASLTASRFGKGVAETRPGKIVVAGNDGKGARVLTTGWSSYVSPDGARIAVLDSDIVDGVPANYRLELFASSGGGPEHVIDVACGPVSWSPDSSKLACAEPERLVVVDASTGAITTLAEGTFGAGSFSPDSTRIVFPQDGTTLKVAELATGTITTLRTGATRPVWGPETIAFATRTLRRGRLAHDVAIIRPDGSGFRRLTRFRTDAEHAGVVPVAWSADGSRLLAGGIGDDFTAFDAYAVDTVRGGLRLITRRLTPSAFSRDGRYVIGQTGSAATSGLFGSDVARVSYARGGRARVLLRHAVYASSNG